MTKKNNRVYGVIGVGSLMSNWNADFTGNPRSMGDGIIFASDKALKYSIKKFWKDQGEKVLYTKTLTKGQKDEVSLLDLGESFTMHTGIEKIETAKKDDVLNGLFSFLDVQNFGATFAVKKHNYSLTGVVQVGQALNVDEDTEIIVMDIISPFRNSNEKSKESQQTSIGKKIVASEAHYIYPFTVNPTNYDTYKDVIDGFEGYTVEAYNKFKEASLVSATALNTNSKSGSFNEFTIFIECAEDSKMFLSNLDKKLKLIKREDKNLLDLEDLYNLLLEVRSEIEKVEIYIDPFILDVNISSNDFIKVYNIFTKKEL